MHEKREVIEAEIVRVEPPAAVALTLLEQPAADLHPARVYLGQLDSERSRVTQEYALRRAAALLAPGVDLYDVAWHRLGAQHVARLRTAMIDAQLAPSTINGTISAVRGVAKAAWILGQMTHEQYDRLRVPRLVKIDEGDTGRRIEHEEFAALFRACADGTVGGSRDAAIVATLYGTGLRRAEAAALRMEHLTRAAGQWRLVVERGKGGKSRVVRPPAGTMLALKAWFDRRGLKPGPIFPALGRDRRLTWHRLSGAAIYRILRRRVKQAGLPKLSPHDCRRTLATDLLEQGKSLHVVATILGHAKLETTMRYDRAKEKAAAEAMEDVDVPFGGGNYVK